MASSSLQIQFLLCAVLLEVAAAALLHTSVDVRAKGSPQNFLHAHNDVRSLLPGVGPLSWNASVAAYAAHYAEKRAGDCNLIHSGGPYGENIFWGSSGADRWSASDAVSFWAAEEEFYDHNSNACSGGECRHYTQVVWSRSEMLGCARVTCTDGGVFITCNYYPPGNVVGERPY